MMAPQFRRAVEVEEVERHELLCLLTPGDQCTCEEARAALRETILTADERRW